MKLISTVAGRIRHVALAIPAGLPEGGAPLRQCLAGILRALDPDVRCTVLHQPPAGDALAREAGRPLDLVTWFHPRALRFSADRARVEAGVLRLGAAPWSTFTPWVQDAFLVSAEPALLASPHVERPEGGMDEDVPPLLAAHLDWPCRPLPLPLAGANVLVDDHHVVIGGEALAQPLERLELPRLLRVPRSGAAPLAHQDMYLTLAGPDRSSGAPVALVGSQRVAAQVTETVVPAAATERALDDVAADLMAAGYVVARLPLARQPGEGDARPTWISYNNGLVEIDRQGNRRVTLPRYGAQETPWLADLDAAAAEVWQRIGFSARFAVGPFARLARSNGSVRCLTKVLARA